MSFQGSDFGSASGVSQRGTESVNFSGDGKFVVIADYESKEERFQLPKDVSLIGNGKTLKIT